MKRILTVSGIALAIGLLFGCDSGTGKTGAAGSASAASAAVTSVTPKSADVKSATDACAGYEKALEACIAKHKGDEKKPWQKELETHQKAFKEAGPSAKTQLESQCITGMATVKQSCKL